MDSTGASEQNSGFVTDFYRTFHDQITQKRHQSPYWLRAYAHQAIFDGFLKRVPPGTRVLDAGCGEGGLSIQLAKKGAIVTGIDISSANIAAAKAYAQKEGVSVEFVEGDIEALPFESKSFDWVVSSHVLEHIPNVAKGASEIARVTRQTALIAMPTCLNPAALALVGRGNYWRLDWKSPFAIPFGILLAVIAWVRGKEGPDEGYVGRKDLPHIWRFPSKMKRLLQSSGLKVNELEAGPILIPYLPKSLSHWQVKLDGKKNCGVFRFLGYGTLAICSPR